jgi:hypothetical protein
VPGKSRGRAVDNSEKERMMERIRSDPPFGFREKLAAGEALVSLNPCSRGRSWAMVRLLQSFRQVFRRNRPRLRRLNLQAGGSTFTS